MSDGGAPGSRVSLASPLAVRNFRNLWIGQSISLVGDQFKFVALSWLVLSLTGRSGALGTVLLLQAIPRSVLMLAGGVASDRLTCRRRIRDRGRGDGRWVRRGRRELRDLGGFSVVDRRPAAPRAAIRADCLARLRRGHDLRP